MTTNAFRNEGIAFPRDHVYNNEPYKSGIIRTDDNGRRIIVPNLGDWASTAEEWLEWYEENGFSAIALSAQSEDTLESLHVLNDDNGNPIYVDEPWSEDSVGLITGEDADDLFDIVLHSPTALALAPMFLPETLRIHSRKGSSKQHWWYQDSPVPQTRTFPDANGNPLVEIRAAGCVTLAPFSVHASGDPIDWHTEIPVSTLPCWGAETFDEDVANLAACTLVVERWGKAESSKQCAVAIADWLMRRGKSYEFADHFVTAASVVAGEPHHKICEIRGLVKAAAEEVAQSSTFRRKTRVEIAGEATTQLIADWLKLRKGEAE